MSYIKMPVDLSDLAFPSPIGTSKGRGQCLRCLRMSHYFTETTHVLKWFERHECSVILEHSKAKVKLYHVHSSIDCAGRPCPIHRRSDHHMRSWAQHWRSDRHFMERICPHGTGHPDPDDPFADPIHGCCGCCHPMKETP